MGRCQEKEILLHVCRRADALDAQARSGDPDSLELTKRNADNLNEAVEKFDLTMSPIVRRKPGRNDIHAWIRQAKRLKPTLTY